MMNLIMRSSIIISLLLLTSCTNTQDKKRSTTTNIAILMPLTEQYAVMGQRAASMIELGLEDGLEGTVKVMTYDIANENKITSAVNKLKARGTKLVLGPIFSQQTTNISQHLAPYGISMITLSNNPAIASNEVYVFGHAPLKQTERIINYMLDQGYKNYITLLPAGRYSSEMAEIMANMIAARRGKLIHSELYTEKEESIEVAVDNIAKIAQSLNELDENNTKPVLYISDDAISLEKIAIALKKYNLDVSTIIIGDNKIDIEYSEPISYLYTGSIDYPAADIIKRLDSNLQVRHLNYIDLMAYDLGRIVAHTIGEGLNHDQFLERLNSGHLYVGASGYVKFVDHIANRKYDIISNSPEGRKVIDKGK